MGKSTKIQQYMHNNMQYIQASQFFLIFTKWVYNI